MVDDGPGIVVVEDDPDIRTLILFALEKDGYRAWGAASGEDGLQLCAVKQPDAIILDLMLPGMDGMALCRRIRSSREMAATPILMLTARGNDDDIVAGLEAGADDYLVKPFANKVLLARIRTILRRGGRHPSGDGGDLCLGPLRLDPERHEVTVAGERVDLTAGEFKTLQIMLRRPGVVFTRSQLLDLVRGSLHAVTDRAVDVQVSGLRKKLGAAGRLVETVRGVGYRIKPV